MNSKVAESAKQKHFNILFRISPLRLVTEYLVDLNYGRAIVRERDRPGRVD